MPFQERRGRMKSGVSVQLGKFAAVKSSARTLLRSRTTPDMDCRHSRWAQFQEIMKTLKFGVFKLYAREINKRVFILVKCMQNSHCFVAVQLSSELYKLINLRFSLSEITIPRICFVFTFSKQKYAQEWALLRYSPKLTF